MPRFNKIRLSGVTFTVAVVFVSLGLACNGGDGEIELVATSEEGEAVVAETPSRSSLLEGVEIVRTVPPTAEGEGDVQPLNRSGPRRGGVLASSSTMCPIPDPAIDSASLFSVDSPPLVTEIHAGLMRTVDDPRSPFELELADAYNVSADGLEYEFVLRNDLKFSDGSALTSSDFKWSWERALKKSISGGRARDVFGLIEGADGVLSGESDDLSGVVAVDDRTLKVKMIRPRADFPALLSDPVASVLKKDNVRLWGTNWTNSGSSTMTFPFNEENMPVGAGPFMLATHFDHPGSRYCGILRNPHYWGELAYLDGVWYRTDVAITERTDDGWMTTTSDPMAFVEEATDFEQKRTVFVTEDSEDGVESDPVVEGGEAVEVDGAEDDEAQLPAVFIFAVLNAAAPPFDDIHFRRAASAFSRLTTFLPIVDGDARLITEELTPLEPRAEFIRYDEVLASSELESSRYAEEVEARKITVINSHPIIVADIEDPSFLEWAQLLNLSLQEDEFGASSLDASGGQRNNRYQIRIFRVTPAYPDPATILRSLTAPFGKMGRAPEFVELDAMLSAAATELDAVRRHEMYLEIEEYVAENALVIPIAVIPETIFFRTHSWVHDLEPPKYPGSLFHRMWLDETAPKRELPLP